MTAAALEERSRAVAARFVAAGLVPGDRVLLSAAASIDLVIAYVAALRAGFVVVPVNAEYRAAEIRHVVRNVTPSAAIVDNDARAAMFRETSDGPLVTCGPDVDLPAGREPELDAADRDTPALICHTSGTTGTPKGAVLTNGNLLASAEALRLAWRWSPDDRLALALPLFHLHGLGVGLHGSLVAGASAVVLGRFDVDAVLDAIADQACSLFFGVPTMYHRFGASARVAELAALRLCVSGSAPLSADLHQHINAACGQRILERYGMTETVMNISNPYEGERRPGSVGFPLPGVEVRLARGEPSGPAADEILIRGPNVFPGYWHQPETTQASFSYDGWFRTGDLGSLDPDGYVRIVGRSKDLIISGGYNVHPREVEDALRAHPAIEDVAVVGLPSEEWGEIVAAFVVARDMITPDQVRAFAGTALAPYKRPRSVHFVDELPRNALGKVLRDQLKG